MWLKTYMDAVALATMAHHGQTRFNSNEPYIMHPVRVSKLIYEVSGDLRLATAGVCHDVLEDTKVTAAELTAKLGSDITRLVQSVTKHMTLPKPDREREFLTRYRNSQIDTVIIKLADRVDNVADLKQQSQNFRARYTENTRELLAATPVFGDHPVIQKLQHMIVAALS